MQVTYTHLDGTTTVFTANTPVTTTHALGDTSILTWSNITPEQATSWVANISNRSTESHVTNGITYYTLTDTVYFTDYGWSMWARERLSPEDFATFRNLHTTVWDNMTAEQQIDDPTFMEWWSRFLQDPHVEQTG